MALALTKKRAPRVHEKTLLNQRLRFNQGYHDAYEGTKSHVTANVDHYAAGWQLGHQDASAGLPHGGTGDAWCRFVEKHEGF